MEILLNSLIFIVGLAILIISSDWLIQGSIKLSSLLRLTPLFVGLVLVAFGTSTPEAGVGIVAAIRNYKEIALGNVIGSNICNIGLILGLCAFVRPLKINKSILRREFPFMLLATVSLFLMSRDLLISRLDGLIFIFGFIAFLVFSYKGARQSFIGDEINNFKFKGLFKRYNSPIAITVLSLISILGIAIGAKLMVDKGVVLANIFGVKPWLIAITVFAVGTSLPELAASLTAALKKAPSISVGNIVGSNIFNILLILGVVSLIRPIQLEASMLKFEFPVLLIFSFTLLIMMKTRHQISRWEGLSLFLGYIGFIFLLIH
ncbi:MAG: calcium/sodium antiporter [Candidatus Omnitrophica bacterium]|nr:calcium/sodium antiporter [Candidatus Omnitrophota bacterium]